MKRLMCLKVMLITPMNQVNVSFVFVITFLKQIFGFSLEYAIVAMI